MANKISLNIAGFNLIINTQEDEAQVRKLNDMLNSDLKQILNQNPSASVTNAALLCALDYLDRFDKATNNANNMRDQIKDYMSDGDYYSAFKEFARLADDYLKQAKTGKPYDKGNLPKKPFKGLRDAFISVLGGLGIGFGRASLLKAETKTVKEAKNARGYLTGVQITGAYEIMTHREFRRIERSSSDGGGSSTHVSSSGSTHGGSSGSF